MRGFGLRAAACVWLIGCGFDTGGVASGGASVGDDTTPTTGGAADDDDDGGPGPGIDADGDDDSATMPESGDPSSADDPSGDPTTDPGGESTTTGDDGEGTTGEPTTDSGDPTTGATDPTTDGGDDLPPPDPYPNCSGPNTCADDAQNCIELTQFMSWEVFAHACAPPCEEVEDCPGPPQGDATAACVNGFCRLECVPEMTTCPDDMQCYEVSDVPDVCLYPD